MDTPTLPGLTIEVKPKKTHVCIESISKSFNGDTLYKDFSLNIPKGHIISIFGPNGCGKSTLINMISGLMEFDAGQVLFDGKTLAQTKIGYVFQNYRDALFPWMNAWNNIAYPLKRMGISQDKVKERVDSLIELFDIKFNLQLYPYELSGGQQQTISIMRALAPEPEVLFLDEPFSALDFEMTLFIRDKLQEANLKTDVTMLIVSHDLEDAVFLADQILLLTRRPTRIAALLDFDLMRPRKAESVSDPKFISIKAKALEIFQREMKS
jgi:NitT/TauT family transport system ATP-binding protein